MASTIVQIRVDEELKEQATDVFERLGLDLPTAFRIFLKRSVDYDGLPFEMKNKRNTIEEKALKALKKSGERAARNGTAGMTMEEIDGEIASARRSRKK